MTSPRVLLPRNLYVHLRAQVPDGGAPLRLPRHGDGLQVSASSPGEEGPWERGFAMQTPVPFSVCIFSSIGQPLLTLEPQTCSQVSYFSLMWPGPCVCETWALEVLLCPTPTDVSPDYGVRPP